MDRDLDLGEGLRIPASEIEWTFSASGGPGGQHANRSNTRAEARLDLAGSPSLRPHRRVWAKLIDRFGGELVVAADDERSQARNRALAIDRMEERLRAALVTRKRRRPTRPSKRAKRRRLDEKRQRSELKRQRRRPDF